MRRIIFNIFAIIFILLGTLSLNVHEATADTITPSDLVSLINGIRTGTYGNPALVVDQILMNQAQWSAQTMADYGIHGHLADNGYPGVRTRIANAGYGGGSTVWATENWAGGQTSYVTLDIIWSYWSDASHLPPMSNPAYQHIGAGVAIDSQGYGIYIVIAAYTGQGGSSSSTILYPTSSGNSGSSTTSNIVQPVLTATPNEDGDTYHIVQSGQALFTIATWYGVTVEEIKTLNALTSNNIYVGDKLLIRIKPTVTITPTRTATIAQPTRTLTPTQATPTPRATVTATPTPKPSLGGFVKEIDRQYLGFGILVISAVGFMIVFYSSFLKPKIRK